MPKILIVHGAGMNMRGKAQIDVFGPMKLPEYDEHIRKYAAELGVEVEIFHSNVEGEVINKFYEAHDRGIDAAIINPAGYTIGYPALMAAIAQVKFPTIELHISNIHAREATYHHSKLSAVATAVICGLGAYGYVVALQCVARLLDALPQTLPTPLRVGPV